MDSLRSLHGLGAAIPGFDRYPERALLLAGEGDAVCVPQPVDPEFLGFLRGLDLGPRPEHVVVAGGAGRGPGRPLAERLLSEPAVLSRAARALGAGEVTIEPYAATADVMALAEVMERAAGIPVRVDGSPRVTKYADQKHHMRARAQDLGVPVAEGEVAELAYAGGRRRRDLEPVRAAIERQLRTSARVIVRGSSGASGSSTFVVGRGGEDTAGVLRRLASRADNRVYLIEAMVEATVSPNVQIHASSRGAPVTCTGITDQRRGRGLTHVGNQIPSSARTVDAMEAWARMLASWMRDQGYTGLVGFDFVEYRDRVTGGPRAILVDVNPRVNGGTYPLTVRARLNAAATRAGRPQSAAFVSGVVETRARSFARVRAAIGHLLFDPDRGTGVVPYATGCLDYGQCSLVALASSRLRAAELYGAARTRLEAA
ncbi:MAG: ATP-grasp domain-containing protein [Gemmatimonadales bacterium]|nr:ATP-grasp domain-containing protein [Gemmatimonadales bacterium]